MKFKKAMRTAYISKNPESLMILKKLGEVKIVESFSQLRQQFGNTHMDLVIIENPDDELWEILNYIRPRNCKIFVLTKNSSVRFIENCYALGTNDIFHPPLKPEHLKFIWGKYFSKKFIFSKFNYISKDPSFWKSLRKLNQLFIDPCPILLQGPTGVGKTHLARMIHDYILGKKPFISFNCAQIPENLIESELFGYKKGAFTGALSDKKGLLSLANSGTLFLDEIGAMSLLTQKKLLKALEEKSFYPVGAEIKESSNFQLISATCEEILENEGFRSDFYYRLEGFVFRINALKDRTYDIPLLLHEYLKNTPRKIVVTDQAMGYLTAYNWPGNVRELKNLIRLIGSTDGGVVRISDLPEKIINSVEVEDNQISFLSNVAVINHIDKVGLNKVTENLENEVFNYFYLKNDQKVRKTMDQLKISNNTFYRIKKRNS